MFSAHCSQQLRLLLINRVIEQRNLETMTHPVIEQFEQTQTGQLSPGSIVKRIFDLGIVGSSTDCVGNI